MKARLLTKALTLTLTCLALTACEFEWSRNGELDGYWQLHQLDTLQGGQADMRNSGIYWGIQMNLLEMRNVNLYNHDILFRFEKSNDKLRIWNPVNDNRDISDSIVNDVNTLNPFGILHLDETFDIETANGEQMVLTNEKFRFHLRKY